MADDFQHFQCDLQIFINYKSCRLFVDRELAGYFTDEKGLLHLLQEHFIWKYDIFGAVKTSQKKVSTFSNMLKNWPSIGRRIRKIRRIRGLGQKDFAAKAQISYGKLHKIEHERQMVTGPEELNRLALALDVPPEMLVQELTIEDYKKL